jgi:hypothetical protein
MSGRSRGARIALVMGLVVASVAAAAGAGEGAPRAPWLEALDRRAGGLVSPAALARAHAELEGVSQCGQCHDGLRATPEALCLDCHEGVAARKAERRGWHGQQEGRCVSCHAEHRGADGDLLGFDRDSWNHEQALFPLRGAHAAVDCDDCHQRAGANGEVAFHAQEIPFERCGDCHDDVHGADFLDGRDCGRCHGEASFRAGALRDGAFDHARDAGFRLEGAHAALPCASCHGDARREAEREAARPPGSTAPEDCGGCHEDPHQRALGADCAGCHGVQGWSAAGAGARFDHARDTRFALDALHGRLACGACHDGLSFAAAGRECADCHADAAAFLAGDVAGARAEADPHATAASCRDCHAENVAAPRLLDYERACLACHPAPYASLLLSRKRLVDERVVAVEAALRGRELARARGEGGGSAEADAVLAERVSRIARSGLHHAPLSEAALFALLESLHGGAR